MLDKDTIEDLQRCKYYHREKKVKVRDIDIVADYLGHWIGGQILFGEAVPDTIEEVIKACIEDYMSKWGYLFTDIEE